jgi:hypothetical protein
MRPTRLALPFAAFLFLAACNPAGNSAQHDFNAAGPALGSGNVGGGATDIGHGFSNGANATGQAITSTAEKVGNSL